MLAGAGVIWVVCGFIEIKQWMTLSGAMAYDDFPFCKVESLLSCVHVRTEHWYNTSFLENHDTLAEHIAEIAFQLQPGSAGLLSEIIGMDIDTGFAA